MNKNPSIIIVTLSLVLLATAASATTVGGIISGDTIWDNTGDPYTIVSPVQIAPNVTLTVMPGVTVTGGAIRVFGTLNASGAPGNRITFDDVTVAPGANSISMADPYSITVDHAVFNSGAIYPATGSAVYGSLSLTDSVLTNTPFMYIWYPVADSYIERNMFVNTGGISVGTSGNVNVLIENNLFVGQTTPYAVENWASYQNSQTIVQYNSFASTDRTALRLPSGYNSAAMVGTNNWWGTTDTGVIEPMIYDRNDDLASASVINYSPFLLSPDPRTPTLSSVPTPSSFALMSGVLPLVWNFLRRSKRQRSSS